MPPRLFPYPLRIGTDVCNVSRLRRIFATKNRHGQPYMLHKFLKKVLTQPERIYFEDRFGQSQEVMTKLEAVSEYLAGRFAAKEAIRKACDHFEDSARGFQSIIILPVAFRRCDDHHPSSPPQGLVLDTPYVQLHEAHQTTVTASYQTAKNASHEALGEEGVMTKHLLESLPSRRHTMIDDLNGQLCEISISHDGDIATAVALVPFMKGQLHATESSKRPP